VTDRHHPAGAANAPCVTVDIPVNDHRAILNDRQQDWLPGVLDNPDGDPLLRAAAHVLGFSDTILYLVKGLLVWIPNLLVRLAAFLRKQFGPRWWLTIDGVQ